MKKYFLLFALVGLVLVSCKEDDEMTTYDVNITIEAPTANTTINSTDVLPVKVVFERGPEEIIHHVKVIVLDADDNQIAVLLTDHVHTAGSYTFENAAAFAPVGSGIFKLKAMSHDMEDNHANPVEVEFTVIN